MSKLLFQHLFQRTLLNQNITDAVVKQDRLRNTLHFPGVLQRHNATRNVGRTRIQFEGHKPWGEFFLQAFREFFHHPSWLYYHIKTGESVIGLSWQLFLVFISEEEN